MSQPQSSLTFYFLSGAGKDSQENQNASMVSS